MNTTTTLNQIGRGNLLAISGGRVRQTGPDTIELPVRYGYSVRVTLDPSDTYRVQRIFRRGVREWVKAQWDRVYCDQLGDVAYRASCYHHEYDDAAVPA